MAALLEQLRSEPSTKLHLNTPSAKLHLNTSSELQLNTPAELQVNSPAAKLQLNSVDGMAQQLFEALRRAIIKHTAAVDLHRQGTRYLPSLRVE